MGRVQGLVCHLLDVKYPLIPGPWTARIEVEAQGESEANVV